MYVAIYVNTFQGRCEPYGPFDAEEDAWHWVHRQEDPSLYTVQEVRKADV